MCHGPHSSTLPAGCRPVPSPDSPCGRWQPGSANWLAWEGKAPCPGLTIDELFPDNLCLHDTLPATCWRESGLSRSFAGYPPFRCASCPHPLRLAPNVDIHDHLTTAFLSLHSLCLVSLQHVSFIPDLCQSPQWQSTQKD